MFLKFSITIFFAVMLAGYAQAQVPAPAANAPNLSNAGWTAPANLGNAPVTPKSELPRKGNPFKPSTPTPPVTAPAGTGSQLGGGLPAALATAGQFEKKPLVELSPVKVSGKRIGLLNGKSVYKDGDDYYFDSTGKLLTRAEKADQLSLDSSFPVVMPPPTGQPSYSGQKPAMASAPSMKTNSSQNSPNPQPKR